MAVYFMRGLLELVRGRDADALAALRAAERLAGHLAAPRYLALPMQTWLLEALVRLGPTERAERALANLGDHDRAETRIAVAVLRLAQHDPHAAAVALAPVLDGSAPLIRSAGLAQAFLLEAIARDALGDEGAAGGPWNARWTWPNPPVHCRGSCCTRCRPYWSATPGGAPPTLP